MVLHFCNRNMEESNTLGVVVVKSSGSQVKLAKESQPEYVAERRAPKPATSQFRCMILLIISIIYYVTG